eukprot:tig00000658_g2917.t1
MAAFAALAAPTTAHGGACCWARSTRAPQAPQLIPGHVRESRALRGERSKRTMEPVASASVPILASANAEAASSSRANAPRAASLLLAAVLSFASPAWAADGLAGHTLSGSVSVEKSGNGYQARACAHSDIGGLEKESCIDGFGGKTAFLACNQACSEPCKNALDDLVKGLEERGDEAASRASRQTALKDCNTECTRQCVRSGAAEGGAYFASVIEAAPMP